MHTHKRIDRAPVKPRASHDTPDMYARPRTNPRPEWRVPWYVPFVSLVAVALGAGAVLTLYLVVCAIVRAIVNTL